MKYFSIEQSRKLDSDEPEFSLRRNNVLVAVCSESEMKPRLEAMQSRMALHAALLTLVSIVMAVLTIAAIAAGLPPTVKLGCSLLTLAPYFPVTRLSDEYMELRDIGRSI